MPRTYTVSNIKRSKRGSVTQCTLLEDGSSIATVRKNATAFWNYWDVTFKFSSERAKARFQDFCDCLSMAETVEALIGLKP